MGLVLADQPSVAASTARVFVFGAFELDEASLELRRDGLLVPTEPRALRVLLYLVERANRWVRGPELLAAIWPRLHVTDAALKGALRDVRRALGDSAKAQLWIQTKNRVGYRFSGSVETRGAAAVSGKAPTLAGGMHGAPRSPSMSFVGRDAELSRLRSLLTDPDALHAQVAIEGLVGVGKSELALQFAYHCLRERCFEGGIFWLNAEQLDLRFEWGGALADAHAVAEGTPARRCSALIALLQQQRMPVLIILDNVESWSADGRPGPLPSGPHIRLLATTRVRNLGGSEFKHVALEVLEPPADRGLLCVLAGRDPGPGLSQLLAALGGHALALELAGAFLATYRSETCASYLAALEAESSEHDQPPVAHAFRRLWERLPEAVRSAWRIAACFAPEPVTRELAQRCGLDVAALRSLERLHLIRVSGDGQFSMHRLTRAFGQRAGTPVELAAAALAFFRGCIARARELEATPMRAGYVPDRVHFNAAVTLPCPADIELELLNAIGPVLVPHAGYSAPVACELYQRALVAAERAGADEPMLAALEGLWATYFSRADWRRSGDLLRRFERLADLEKNPSCERRLALALASGQYHLYTGAIAQACQRFQNGLELASDRHLGKSAQRTCTQLLGYAAAASCIAGATEQGLQLARHAVRHALRERDFTTLAQALVLRAAVHEFRGEPAQVERFAARAAKLAHELDLPTYARFATVQLHWARFTRDPRANAGALDNMLHALHELVQQRIGVARPHLVGLAAAACAQVGRQQQARALIEEALQLSRESWEGFTEPELWRLRATLSDTPDETIGHLEYALQLAAARGAQLWELRCLNSLVECAPSLMARRSYAARLRNALAMCGERRLLSDARRARALLQDTP